MTKLFLAVGLKLDQVVPSGPSSLESVEDDGLVLDMGAVSSSDFNQVHDPQNQDQLHHWQKRCQELEGELKVNLKNSFSVASFYAHSC